MRNFSAHCSKRFISFVALLYSLGVGSAQFVEVTALVNLSDISVHPTEQVLTIHLVVGTNSWRMDGDFCSNCTATYWFTGGTIIEHTKITKMPSTDGIELSEAEISRIIGAESTRAYECPDGNPNRPSAEGPMQLEVLGRIGWLAFCSGPYLKREGREMLPPNDLWRHSIPAKAFRDITVSFDDNFGLPKRMDLYATNSPNVQPVLQYRVVSSTNILGWEIPMEFKIAQYRRASLPGSPGFIAGTNGWELEFVATGKVTAVGPGMNPQIPANVLRAIGK